MKKLASLIVLVLSLSCVALAADWPQFCGPARDGKSPETGLIHAFPADGPKVVWTVRLNEGFGSAAIVDGELYVIDHEGANDQIRCFDAATGQEKWKCEYEAPGKVDFKGSRGVPAVTDKYVIAVGPFGHAACVDRKTHEKVWLVNVLTDFGGKMPQWGVAQSPLVYKDSVILAPQNKQIGLVALDLATGKEKWRSEPLGGMAYVSPYLTKLDGVEQIIMLSDSTVVGVGPDTGKILWKYPAKVEGAKPWKPDNPIPAPVALGDGRFFLTEGYGGGSAMIKVTKAGEGWDVAELYKTQACGAQIQLPLLIEGYLYMGSNSNSRHEGLLCLRPEDGEVMWKTDKSPNFERGGLIYADGVIYAMEGDTGILRIVQPSPDGYKQLAQAKLLEGKQIWSPMAISNGFLFCRDQKQLKCVDLRANKTESTSDSQK